MHDPADIEEQRRAEDEIEAATIGMEVAVLAIIARRLGKLKGKSFVEVYAAMPKDLAEIRKVIDEGVKGIENVTSDIMESMAKANDQWAKRYYEHMGVEQVPALEHRKLSSILKSNTKEALSEINAICRSSVVSILDEGTKRITTIEAAYNKVVTQAANLMVAGSDSVDGAIAKTVKGLSQSGLRVVYQSGTTRNLYSAVSTNVMDAYRVAMSEMREVQGQEYGADGVEVSAHALCAKDHQEYQGNQYSYERKRGYRMWDEVQNEPSRPLVSGANCGHTVSPVILGISEPAYSKRELENLKRLSNEEVTFTGLSGNKLTMSRYDASQYQRQLETKIRQTKENAYLLKEADLTNFAKMERATSKAYAERYRLMSEEARLRMREDRTRIHVQK